MLHNLLLYYTAYSYITHPIVIFYIIQSSYNQPAYIYFSQPIVILASHLVRCCIACDRPTPDIKLCTYHSPERSCGGGDNGSCSRHVVHQGQLSEAALVVITTYIFLLAINSYVNVIFSTERNNANNLPNSFIYNILCEQCY